MTFKPIFLFARTYGTGCFKSNDPMYVKASNFEMNVIT